MEIECTSMSERSSLVCEVMEETGCDSHTNITPTPYPTRKKIQRLLLNGSEYSWYSKHSCFYIYHMNGRGKSYVPLIFFQNYSFPNLYVIHKLILYATPNIATYLKRLQQVLHSAAIQLQENFQFIYHLSKMGI